MTENKRYVYIEHKNADYILEDPNYELDFIEMLGDCLEPEEIVDRLNEQEKRIEKLEKLQRKRESEAKTLLNFYSKRYVDAVFDGQKNSETLREELWIVKQILSELELYEDD